MHAAAAPSIGSVVSDLDAVCAEEHVNVGMPLAAGVDEAIVLGPARIRPVHIELCSTAVVISMEVEPWAPSCDEADCSVYKENSGRTI